MPHGIRLALIATLLATPPASAQTLTAGGDVYFYGDNTEFTNPFRSGDTTLGASGRVFIDAKLNDTVTLRGGVFGLGRFGSHEALEHAEPVIALQLSRGPSRLLFGSLDTVAFEHEVVAPDEETPHRLLPPLQVETLSFLRGQEMGLQWLVDSASLQHDAWLNWQRLNTETHRERFDAGYRGALNLSDTIQLHGQWHVVHEGGQQFDSGAVNDSQAGALGLRWSRGPSATLPGVSVDAHVVASRDVPDRAAVDTAESGLGVFTRAALTRGGWRGHVIVWRGRDVIKAEGDTNYQSRQRDGRVVHYVRDYAEAGLTRHFTPAPDVHMFATVRIHRTESHYEYSYRIVGRVRLRRTW
jgi:hypothetical protein